MDKRTEFWREGYARIAFTETEEHDINIYTKHGWNTRIKIFSDIFENLVSSEKLASGMLALDMGCGSGKYSQIMLNRGLKVVASDICLDMLEVASGRHGPGLRLVCAECSDLPFKNDCFDFIISFGVISIITDPEYFFHELRRVSRNNSIVMLMTLNKNYIPNLWRCFNDNRHLPEDLRIIEYSHSRLKKRLGKIFDGKIKFIPVFIFPKQIRFLENIFQNCAILRFAGKFLASAFILQIKTA